MINACGVCGKPHSEYGRLDMMAAVMWAEPICRACQSWSISQGIVLPSRVGWRL